jgi:LysM repeat protein
MKKIIALSLVLTSVIIIGCKPNTSPADAKRDADIEALKQQLRTATDTHPANLVGKWKAEFTPVKEADVTVGITTEANGAAVFGEQTAYTIARGDTLPLIARAYSVTVNQILQANPGLSEFNLSVGQKILTQTETISGTWKHTDDYLIIERPNGGFVAFRISSQSANQLTVFSRTGQTIQFNRIP